jgi:hypothetical protein
MSGAVATIPVNEVAAAPVPVMRIRPSRGWTSLRLDEQVG